MVIKEITRSNVLDIVEFLGAAYVNLIIERHPSQLPHPKGWGLQVTLARPN